MKVLVFPVLLAIAIITGPPKPGTSPAATAQAKPATATTIASVEPGKTSQLTPNSPATLPKDAASQQLQQPVANKVDRQGSL